MEEKMLKDKPLISIIIPTYNHSAFLKEAIKSVVAQTYQNWEAIVVNNFSDDDTVDVVNSFNDPRIHLVNFRNYGIIAASRNKGISLARGQWMAFLDSDDIWYPQKLEKCVSELDDIDIICHSEVWVVNGEPFTKMTYGPYSRFNYRRLLFDGNCLSTSAVIVRRTSLEQVGGFSEDAKVITAEDYDLWLKLSHNHQRILFINDMLGEYRLHATNASKNVEKNTTAIFAVLEKHFNVLEDRCLLDHWKLRRTKALVLSGAGRNLQRDQQYRDSISYTIKAIRTYPVILKPYLVLILAFASLVAENIRKP